MTDARFHPAAEIFPLMEGEAFDTLTADIKANGQKEKIVRLPTGEIIDGRNRYRACAAAAVVPQFRDWVPTGSETVVSYVLSLNLHRRHLSEAQRAMVAAKIANIENGDNQHTREGASKEAPSQPLSQSDAGKLLNVSRPSVQRAKAVIRTGVPELVEAVERGEMPVATAAKVAQMEPDQQRAVVAERKAPPVTPTVDPDEWEPAAKPAKAPKVVTPPARSAPAQKLIDLLDAISRHVNRPSVQISYIDLRQQVKEACEAAASLK